MCHTHAEFPFDLQWARTHSHTVIPIVSQPKCYCACSDDSKNLFAFRLNKYTCMQYARSCVCCLPACRRSGPCLTGRHQQLDRRRKKRVENKEFDMKFRLWQYRKTNVIKKCIKSMKNVRCKQGVWALPTRQKLMHTIKICEERTRTSSYWNFLSFDISISFLWFHECRHFYWFECVSDAPIKCIWLFYRYESLPPLCVRLIT